MSANHKTNEEYISMKSKRWIPWVGIVFMTSIVIVVSAFLFADIRLMSSRFTQNSSMASSTGSTQSFQQIQPTKTGLVVGGGERLARELQDRIARQLEGNPLFGQIELLPSIIDKTGYPILVVEIAPPDISWTPIVAQADLKVTVSYASDGDTSFRLTRPVEFKNTGEQPVLKRSGEYTFSDLSRGLISSPGYINYLANQITRSIVKDLTRENE